MDHYLGKEMVKNILSVRFKNPLFSRLWSHEGISQIEILFKEMIGVEGRGHYFDNYGIVRDVMQNHLLQIMTLIAMEEPEVIHPRTADLGKTSIMDATSVNGDAIRNEKVNVLACIRPLDIQQVLLGQYTGCSTATATVNASDKALLGYKEDPTVPDDSMTATYAKCVLYVANERWQSVPFILQCGKALDEQKTEIKITFKNGEMNLKNENIPEMKDDTEITNELVIRVSAPEGISLRVQVKSPGILQDPQNIMSTAVMDLNYNTQFPNTRIPDAYETLLLDVLEGNHSNFVRKDELEFAWKIFTPLLHLTDQNSLQILPYERGSSGPVPKKKELSENDL